MIRINKSNCPHGLNEFRLSNPNATWQDFKNYNGGSAYRAVRDKIFNDQYFICAYCEAKIPVNELELLSRVEHFNSKSGTTHGVGINYHLDWGNLLGVCVGGERDGTIYALPDNLSCDSHKGHWECKNHFTPEQKNWVGKVLSPLDIPSGHILFDFVKSTGGLKANELYCASVVITGNQLTSTTALVEETIKIFNLNCDRLNRARLEIFHEFSRARAKAAKQNDITPMERLVLQWLRDEPLMFQTTRNILIRQSAMCMDIINRRGMSFL
ncbi:HNH endonuclease family protein [Plesiomonas shigelloides]|uniref:TIGR02646 family protein n=1 Tax=Plesiomonas shigelloides TaxID=703 RepID=UPI00387F0F7F